MNRKTLITIFLLSALTGIANADIVPIDSIQGYSDSSPYTGQVVTTAGVVTAPSGDWIRSISGFFIQDAEAPWHGIFVYTGALTLSLERGDSVEVTGEVQEFYGCTEITVSSAQDVKILKHGARIPKPLLVTAQEAMSEAYEGVLIQVANVTVTNPDLGYGEWEVSDSTGSAIVDDAAGYSYTPVLNDFIPSIVGVLHYSYGEYKIEPRRDADIIFSTDGTGYAYFETNTYPAEEVVDLRLVIEGIVPDTLKNIVVEIPYEFNFTGSITLEGTGFLNASYSISGDGSETNPYRIYITGATVTRDDGGTIILSQIQTPLNAGAYSFNILTSKIDTPQLIPDLPTLNVLTLEGSGNATIYPFISPINQPVEIEITITNNFGTIQRVLVLMPDNIEWNGDYTLLDEGFDSATAYVTDTSLYIEGAALTTGSSGRIILRNFVFRDSIGIKQFTILTGGSDTLDTIQECPRMFAALEDTTIPLYVFHIDTLQEFLKGNMVKVKGVVTGIVGSKAFIQDTTGGLILYQPPELREGDFVKLEGQYSDFHGADQLYSSRIIQNFGQSPYDTLALESPPGEAQEGMLVRVNNLTPPSGLTSLIPDSALSFSDTTGQIYVIYIDPSSELAYRELPSDEIDIIGEVSQFDDVYQITPRKLTDVILKGDGTGTVSFNPPFVYRDSSLNLDLIFLAPYTPIQSLEISFSGASFDTLVTIGSGWNGITWPDTFAIDSTGIYMKFIGGISLTGDTLVFANFRPQDVDSIVFNIKTSKDSAGYTVPVMQDLILYVATPIARVQAPGEDGYTPQDSGEVVTVCGVVTAPPGIFSEERTSCYIQDFTGGVNIYYGASYIPLEAGDLVKVRGTVTEYKGLTEVSPSSAGDIKIIGKWDIPEPYVLSEGEALREDLEGILVKVRGEVAQAPYTSGSGKAFTVWNGTVPVEVYVYNSTGIDVTSVEKGSAVEITGICGQYDSSPPYTSGYQIIPRFDEDIVVLGGAVSEEVNLQASPNVFSPYLGEALELRVEGPLDATYYLRIYDSRGKVVKTLFEGARVPGVVYWRGDDESGRNLPIGSYIVLLEVQKPDGGVIRKHKLVVISRPK